MKYRIMKNGHGRFFVQRKFMFWWIDETMPLNEASDCTVTFSTEEEAERYIQLISRKFFKPTFVKYVLVNENNKEVK